MTITPQPDDQSLVRFQQRAPEMLQSVREMTVLDDASYLLICEHKLAASEMLKTLKTITDTIKRTHKTALESALIPWERIMAPIAEAAALAEQKRKEYRDAQERKQQAEVTARLAADRKSTRLNSSHL